MYLKQQLLRPVHMLNRKMLLCKLHITPLAYILRQPTCKMQYKTLVSVTHAETHAWSYHIYHASVSLYMVPWSRVSDILIVCFYIGENPCQVSWLGFILMEEFSMHQFKKYMYSLSNLLSKRLYVHSPCIWCHQLRTWIWSCGYRWIVSSFYVTWIWAGFG